MTADIRTAAQKEAQRISDATSDVTKQGLEWEWGFADGAVWAQARLTPTREDIADVLAGAYDEWCVLLKEFLAGRVDDPGSEYEYKADAILALIAGLAEERKDQNP